jgi:hypothetical protein
MAQEFFTKVSNSTTSVPLSGFQKVAILMGELYGQTEGIESFLTTSELKKINFAMQNMDKKHVERIEEIKTLSEVNRLCAKKGFTDLIDVDPNILVKKEKTVDNRVSKILAGDTKNIAEVISKWLKEDK